MHRWLAKVHPDFYALATIYAKSYSAPIEHVAVMLGSGVLGVSLVVVEDRQSTPGDSFPLVAVVPACPWRLNRVGTSCRCIWVGEINEADRIVSREPATAT